ncbi:MAG: hypothetical protein ACRBM6_30415 [Geminicoccales bacterium]
MGKRVIDKGTVFWLMASAGLAGVITLQVQEKSWLAMPVIAATAEPDQEQGRVDSGIASRLPDVDWLDRIVERPLFSASRRPFSPAEGKPAARSEPEVETLDLTLTGILLAGEDKVALLAHPKQGLLRLRQGQKVDGWRVDQINGDEVRLKRGGKVTLLSLRKSAFDVIGQPPAAGAIQA